MHQIFLQIPDAFDLLMPPDVRALELDDTIRRLFIAALLAEFAKQSNAPAVAEALKVLNGLTSQGPNVH